MLLARVIGHVVATQKEAAMTGQKLLLLRPLVVDDSSPVQLKPAGNTVVAVDPLGAGEGETVMFCQGSSARQAQGMQSLPVDAVIVGIVDTVEVQRQTVHPRAAEKK
ncbi:EutN/CcmL family microcompartment protein [Horticoccus luteus]|uniref:EutN/CcmL family microcompartment protein n=1 Tax=Horticoccus luteus TaxID=2862869 RepID=A0A8F9TZ49_9BACT|nr:EutN/CcmL family microcompartment protein [Horticoccus luteus]QYM80682.1 EutN/CcmL family microcompartment protein [Horticoccus luteus]